MLSGKPEKDNSIEVLKILNKISEKLKIAKASITKTHNKAIQNITNSLKRITSKLEEFEIGESKSIFDKKIRRKLFVSFHFSFFVSFGDEVTKIQKYYVIFVYILQGEMGNTEI